MGHVANLRCNRVRGCAQELISQVENGSKQEKLPHLALNSRSPARASNRLPSLHNRTAYCRTCCCQGHIDDLGLSTGRATVTFTNRILIISDLHLGGAPASRDKPAFQMCTESGRQRLVAFLAWIA